MPRILIVTDAGDAGEVVYSEKLVPAHLQTEHAGRLLVERLAWALEDARQAERKRAAEISRVDSSEGSRKVVSMR